MRHGNLGIGHNSAGIYLKLPTFGMDPMSVASLGRSTGQVSRRTRSSGCLAEPEVGRVSIRSSLVFTIFEHRRSARNSGLNC